MATIAEIQTVLGNYERSPRIVRTIMGTTAGVDKHYVVGGMGHAGRCRWIETTQANDAATQGAAILAGLIA